MNKQVASGAIEARMRDYFERQIAWFDSMLGYVVESAADMERGEVEKTIEEHRSREKELVCFSDEFWSLKNEWDVSENISSEARAEIGALARKADALSVDVRLGLDRGGEIATSLAKEVQRDLGKLRTGKQILDRYRPGLSEIADFVDRKA